MGGSALKPIGLGHVKQFRRILSHRIALIGVGGIANGHDVKDYLAAGASAVQVGTAAVNRGYRIYQEIISEYISLIQTNNILSDPSY
ncbi:MAG: dihydroorotate dehydrogenase (fumarate) [Parcubacteria group bacterium Gr01-1014_66]|nr:MAG: dihydroorotate dehydrogenase (fumarate) [Parcubacteria group bacterium Gr01-1014_66]